MLTTSPEIRDFVKQIADELGLIPQPTTAPPPPTPPGPVPAGAGPTIAVFTQAANYSKSDLAALLPVMQKFVDQHLAPIWGTPCTLQLTDAALPGHWWMVFLDTADAPGALAYHDLTTDGYPLAKVFVETIRSASASISVAATHELAEMLVDPDINLAYYHVFDQSNAAIYAGEVGDPVEAENLGFTIDGVLVTDFAYPAWWQDFTHPAGTKFDHTGKCTAPFQILPGGYMIVNVMGQWTQIFAKGDSRKMRDFGLEDRRGHRSEIRTRNWKQRSEV